MTENMEQIISQALIKDIDRWLTADLFGDKPKSLHVIIIGDDDTMLMVAKQMALLAHFPTFDEKNLGTRTRISILGKVSTGDDWKKPFGNLLNWQPDWIKVPLDIELEHIALTDDEAELNTCADKWMSGENASSQYLQVVYDADTIKELKKKVAKVLKGDERENLAKRANMVYEASQRFDIIHAKTAKEYRGSVKGFLKIAEKEVETSWMALEEKLKLSNYFLVDSLLVRIASLHYMKEKHKWNFLLHNELYDTLEEHLLSMSQSEHARWNVEKLIDGYRPFTYDEIKIDNGIQLEADRKNYEREQKNNPAIRAHFDLCSYEDLCKRDPNSVKYDSFLLLALVRYYESKL